jgi:predicted Fe-Mo cluster-binding NifX family protein
VDFVIAFVLGFGATELLKQHNIKYIPIKPNTKVREALREAIQKLKEENIANEVIRKN